jgi:class 3 adenylate cyclase
VNATTSCPSCSAKNVAGARFCSRCGTRLAERCTSCGGELQEGAWFCPSCGTPLAPELAPEERKIVTVLFADIVGSTSLAEHLDNEHLREVLDAYHRAMREEVEAAGGTVDKFIGDAVMAVFGLPAAHEDDPERALHAALRMRSRLEQLNHELSRVYDLTLQTRVGINTGEVSAISSPSARERILGDIVNVAARLEQTAEPNQVLLGERTARSAPHFRFRELDPIALKGKEKRISAFELISEERKAARKPHVLRTPLIGRDRELSVLTRLQTQTSQEAKPHLVTIYGEPGVGKSRLIAEFVGALNRPGSTHLLRGRCPPYGDGLTYWPLAEILKHHATVLENDAPEVVLDKVRRAGQTLFGEQTTHDPRRTVAALAYTVGVEDPDVPLRGLDPRSMMVEIHEAWRLFFSAFARAGPTTVVIEDLHWADPALLDLIEELVDRTSGALLFACTARPELATRRAGWGDGRVNFSSIPLEPLPPKAADRLVGSILAKEKLPSRLVDRILERGGGNPFFIEEIILKLMDEGMLVRVDGRWEPMPGADEVEIPDTVQAVISSRIDLLSAAEKQVVQYASVIGQVFWTGPLCRLLGSSQEETDELLLRAQDRQLVLGRAESSMLGDREYSFKHVLTRDVAYERLLRRERARAHATVAGWIEETAGGRKREFLELLAHHYERGYRYVEDHPRDDRPASERLRSKALEYALLASDDARGKLVLGKAGQFAEQALSLAAKPAEQARAHQMLGEKFFTEYQGDRAWAELRLAADAALETQPIDRELIAALSARAAEIPTRFVGIMHSPPSVDEFETYFDRGMRHIPEGNSEERSRLLIARAFLFSYQGSKEELQEAERVAREAAWIASELDRPELEAAALDALISCAMDAGGFYGKAVPITRRRLELVDRVQDVDEIGDIYAMAAWTQFNIGHYGEARRLAEQGIERSRHERPASYLHCLATAALAYCRLGEWERFLQASLG